jgi:hypothetical protein
VQSPGLLSTTDLDTPFLHEKPPFWLVLAWIIFKQVTQLNDGGDESCGTLHTRFDLLLRQIPQSKIIDLWSWDDADEMRLSGNAFIGAEDPSFAPWINSYPRSWRDHITELTFNDWLRLRNVTQSASDSRSKGNAPLYPLRRRLTMPHDGYLWVGAVAWTFLSDLPDPLSNPSKTAATWLRSLCNTSQFRTVLDPLNLPLLQHANISEDFRNALDHSGHTCYVMFSKSSLVWYVTVRSWFENSEEIQVVGLEAFKPTDHRVCSVCKACNSLAPVQEQLGEMLLHADKLENALMTGFETSGLFQDCPTSAIRLPLDYPACLLRLGETLANFTTSSSPFKDPAAWLHHSRGHILESVCNFTCLGSGDKIECLSFICETSICRVRFVFLDLCLMYSPFAS